MVLWGLILAVAGFIAALCTFLDSTNIFSDMTTFGGFGAWLNRFFDPAFLTGKKVVFYIAVVLLVVGAILFVVGKIKSAKTGENDKQTEKGIKFFRDLKGEFKKITWPTMPTVVRNTGVTLALCAILGLIICLIDFGCGALVQLMQALG